MSTTLRSSRSLLPFLLLGTLALGAGCKKEAPKGAPRKIALGYTAAGTVVDVYVHEGEHLSSNHRRLMKLEPAEVGDKRAAEEAASQERSAAATLANTEGNVALYTRWAVEARQKFASHSITKAELDRAEQDLAEATAGHKKALQELADIRNRMAPQTSERAGHASAPPHVRVPDDAVHVMVEGWMNHWLLDWPAETETDHKKSGVIESIRVQKGDKLAANAVVAIIVEDDAEEGEAKN